MTRERVLVIGAGVGGLVAALELAAHGLEVTVLERQPAPGGKMRQVHVGGRPIDAGPTVFTMRWVFEELFEAMGASLGDQLSLRRLDVLARHAWQDGSRLDLFADIERSAEAIGTFAGQREANGFREFCARAARIYQTLEAPFMRAERPANPLVLAHRVARRGLGDLRHIEPFASYWRTLGAHFKDPRLRQLFGRYATYLGSSPFQAPATLMLVAHVEQDGVWRIEGGMHQLARTLARLAEQKGAQFRYGCEAKALVCARNRACGITLSSGEVLEAEAIVVNADPAALAAGHFGPAARRAVPALVPAARSLSALTFCLETATAGFPLLHHNVFFSDDYRSEFDQILKKRQLPDDPTVYLCAQDRGIPGQPEQSGPERLLCLVNAPPEGDSDAFQALEIERCANRTFRALTRAGLQLSRQPEQMVATSPKDFEHLFPGTGGALYGPASHGWMASFRRPGARTRIPGLYLASGSAHPGPGVPMAALSGRIAVRAVFSDLASRTRSRRMATLGGTSMR